MSFLTLVQKTGRYLRATNADASSSISTTVSQTGVAGEIVNCVNDSYQEIQEASPEWYWRRAIGGTLALSSTNRIIALATITATLTTYQELRPYTAINRAQYILMYLTATGVSDESEVWYVPYPKWAGWFNARTIPTGKPQYFTIRPDRAIEFDRTLDASYTALFDYTKAVDVLSGNVDEPYIPSQYQDAIVWGAVKKYCVTRGGKADALLLKATREYNQIYGRMTQTEMPSFSWNRGVFAGWP